MRKGSTPLIGLCALRRKVGLVINRMFMCEAWGIHDRDYEDNNLLGYNCSTLL